MSTGKFNEVATQGTTADIAIARSGSTAKDKFTAADIATDCPARLQEIGRDITERLEQAREQAKRLDANVIAVNKLISEQKIFATSAASINSGSCSVRQLGQVTKLCAAGHRGREKTNAGRSSRCGTRERKAENPSKPKG